jgi:hypothetical protein
MTGTTGRVALVTGASSGIGAPLPRMSRGACRRSRPPASPTSPPSGPSRAVTDVALHLIRTDPDTGVARVTRATTLRDLTAALRAPSLPTASVPRSEQYVPSHESRPRRRVGTSPWLSARRRPTTVSARGHDRKLAAQRRQH